MLFLNSFKSLNISEEAPSSEYSQTYAGMTAIKCTWLHGWKLGWGDRRAQDEKTEANTWALIAPNVSEWESPVCVRSRRRQVREGWILVISCQSSNEQCLRVIPCAATFQGVKMSKCPFPPRASQKQHCQGSGCKQWEKERQGGNEELSPFHPLQSECQAEKNRDACKW